MFSWPNAIIGMMESTQLVQAITKVRNYYHIKSFFETDIMDDFKYYVMFYVIFSIFGFLLVITKCLLLQSFTKHTTRG